MELIKSIIIGILAVVTAGTYSVIFVKNRKNRKDKE